MKTSSWFLTGLTEQYYADALSLVCNEFFPYSSLHNAVEMDRAEFEGYMTQEWHSYISKCPLTGLVAVDVSSNSVVGCLIPARFPSDYSDLESLTSKRQSIAVLLQKLEAIYLQTTPSLRDALMVDIAVVSKAAGGQGIYQSMRKKFQLLAAANGYRYVIGALSSAATQKVCIEKLNHEVVSEIRFSDYNELENYPFASITSPKSIQLVVCPLN